MKEYATMYAGGQHEGEFEMREELSKLRQRDWTEGGEENPDSPPESSPESSPGEESTAGSGVDIFDENTDEIPELLSGDGDSGKQAS